MLMRLLYAVGVFIVVYVAVYVVGTLLGQLGIPLVATIGSLLVQFAVLVAAGCAILNFAGGTFNFFQPKA